MNATHFSFRCQRSPLRQNLPRVSHAAVVGAVACTVAVLMAASAPATIVSGTIGNGNSGFGGVLGTGSISIDNTSSGALTFTFTKGSGALNDAVVLYIQSGTATTFTTTANFTDRGTLPSVDQLRQAISGFDGTNRSTLNFTGLSPNYAIAFGASAGTQFGGLWQLADNGSFPFIASMNLTPISSTTSATYTLTANVSNIGLTPNSGESFRYVATYLNASNAFRSNEAFGSGFGGSNAGYTTVTIGSPVEVVTVPEPDTVLMLGLGVVSMIPLLRRRKVRDGNRSTAVTGSDEPRGAR